MPAEAREAVRRAMHDAIEQSAYLAVQYGEAVSETQRLMATRVELSLRLSRTRSWILRRGAARSRRWVFQATSHAPSGARAAIHGFAQRHDLPVELHEGMVLAISEAVSNAVVHAYRDRPTPGEVEVEVAFELEEPPVSVHVRDTGSGFRPAADSPGLGLGLPLMASVTEHFEIRPASGGGTEIVLRFARTA